MAVTTGSGLEPHRRRVAEKLLQRRLAGQRSVGSLLGCEEAVQTFVHDDKQETSDDETHLESVFPTLPSAGELQAIIVQDIYIHSVTCIFE